MPRPTAPEYPTTKVSGPLVRRCQPQLARCLPMRSGAGYGACHVFPDENFTKAGVMTNALTFAPYGFVFWVHTQ
jgi:hypothetical protein